MRHKNICCATVCNATLSLGHWAQIHVIDLRIAGAIYELTKGEDAEMQRISKNPSKSEVEFILQSVPKDQHINVFWNGRSLDTVKGS